MLVLLAEVSLRSANEHALTCKKTRAHETPMSCPHRARQVGILVRRAFCGHIVVPEWLGGNIGTS